MASCNLHPFRHASNPWSLHGLGACGTLSVRRFSAVHKSEYRGVCWYEPYKKWLVRVNQTGQGRSKQYNLGYFANELEAASAYDLGSICLLSGKARTNFPRVLL